MRKKLVSVIIPIYNSEKYLKDCLESVINQTYTNLEIILVNDGSVDNSEEIAKEYADKDKRIKYFYKNNEGCGLTRNFGYEKSNGEYIYFLDSDDYIDITMIEKLYNAIKKTDSFSVVLQGFIVTGDNKVLHKRSIEEIKLLRSPSVCIRLFNNNVLKNSQIKFSDIKIGEDLEFVMKVMLYNNKISYVDEPLYYYCIHNDSTIHSGNSNDALSILNAINIIEKYAKQIGKYEENRELFEYINVSHVLYATIRRIMEVNNYKDEDVLKCIKFVIDKYPLWYENSLLETYFKTEWAFIESLREKYNF